MLRFRPHHFLCALGFQGKGYSSSFVDNFSAIKNNLTSSTLIRVVEDAEESICNACPNKDGLSCSSQEKISNLDRLHKEVLGFHAGMEITWMNAVKRIQNRITLSKFKKMCRTCAWEKAGYCESAIKNL